MQRRLLALSLLAFSMAGAAYGQSEACIDAGAECGSEILDQTPVFGATFKQAGFSVKIGREGEHYRPQISAGDFVMRIPKHECVYLYLPRDNLDGIFDLRYPINTICTLCPRKMAHKDDPFLWSRQEYFITRTISRPYIGYEFSAPPTIIETETYFELTFEFEGELEKHFIHGQSSWQLSFHEPFSTATSVARTSSKYCFDHFRY